MANNQRFSITFDASLNVSQMKGALNDIQKSLNNLHLPQNATKGLQGTFSKLSEEIQKFEVAAGKEIGSKADFSKIEKSATRIGELFGILKRQVSELTGKSGKELAKLFPEDITKKITNATNALNAYKESTNAAKQAVTNAAKEVDKFNKKLNNEQKKVPVSDVKYKEIVEENKKANEELNRLEQEREALVQKHETLEARLQKQGKNPGKAYKQQEQNIQDLNEAIQKQRDLVKQTAEVKASSTTFDQQAKNVANFSAKLEEAKEKLKTTKEILDKLESNGTEGGLTKLKDEVGRLTGLDMSKFKTGIEGIEEAIQSLSSDQLEKLRQGFGLVDSAMENSETEAQTLGKKLQELGNEVTSADSKMREVDALKSRIQYFFGLNNTIELVKRTIRSAFETVKELDKAMTETAVVTDFSVADMWAQLPDYTKRANDLGVTTKAAYEAATLYYQQGLKTNEVTAMSNETLKMARIAGLDAAVATDRMTNAIRGFNMEINEMNAQRIDDVYSKLAAISASNVDEISTAMTKVASLANNANMEFETTSAFLAQIIETTRESAETAGTALKTVVARFSEVKKLVNEDQLKGQDEEGQLIDVNKVSQALRTAGVDLNKYFLGEVGLDDIFMELASKWDSLTTLQQRYIATQAAGSRQQSRFIALMSDYGRMQELVGEAYNANGAAAEQFAKTQESLESKLARLKNAWNEFAMGIANSDLVKAGVDFLTLLLNSVNKLTDGFGLLTGSVGGFVSSILKLGLLIGGLNLGKNLIGGGIGGIGSLLKGESFKGGFGKAMGVEPDKGVFKTLGKGFISPFKNIGESFSLFKETDLVKNIWGGAKGLGGKVLGGITGLGPGLGIGEVSALEGVVGLTTAIGGITVAAGAAYAAIKKLYDLSPAGQVKIAEKLVNALSSASKVAKENENNLKDAQSVYSEKTDTVNSAKNIEDYNKAILDRNEYISSLLEQDATYAQYIESVVNESGQFVLTFKEGALDSALKEAEEATKNAEIQEFFAQGLLKNKEALAEQSRIDELNQLSSSAYNDNIQAEIQRREVKRNQLQNESEAFSQSAFNKMLEDTNLPGTIAQGLSKVLADSFDMTEYSKEVQKGTGFISRIFSIKANKKKAFEEVYGKGSAEGLSEQELIEGINSKKATEKQQTKADDITNLFKGKTGQELTKYTKLLDAYNGAIDFNVQELENSDIQGVLQDFEKALGVDVAAVKAHIRASQEQRKEIKTNNQANIFSTALQKGVDITKELGLKITSLDFEDTEAFNSLLENLSGKVGDTAFQGLFEDIPGLLASNEFDAINKFAQSFNLDQPIAAFRALKEAEEQAAKGGILQSLVEDAKEVNAAVLDTGNLFQSFALSDSYEDVAKSAADLIEENGRLTADNINELAGSCEDLATLLEIDTITAQGLANALTGLEMGNITLEGLTTNTLAAISAGQSYNDLLDDIHKTIEDFDAGIDTGEGSDFLVEQSEELAKLLDNWEFGNEQTKNIYDKLFANENLQIEDYKDFMEGWDEGDSGDFEQRAKARVEQLKGWAENNSYGFMREFADKDNGLGITSNGAYDFNWDLTQFQSTDELIQRIADTAQVSTDAAKMLFEGFATQSYSVQQAWDNLDYETKLKAFADSAGDATSFTQQELETLGRITGKTTDEVLQDFKQLREEGGQPIKMPVVVNWQDKDGKKLTGKALQREFEKFMPKNVSSLGAPTVNYEQYARENDFGSDKVKGGLNLDKIFADAAARGMDDSQAEEYANSFVQKINGALLTKTIKVPQLSEDNEIVIDEVEVTGETVEEVKTKIETMQKEADYTIMGQKIAEAFGSADLSGVNDKLLEAVQGFQNKIATAANGFSAGPISNSLGYAANNFANQLQSALNSKTFHLTLNTSGALGGKVIKPHANNNNGFHNVGGDIPAMPQAKGGRVRSYGSGGRNIAPGLALTGEEGPEIVWNKEGGYSYVTGKNGPEYIELRPGDRIFTAGETSRIFRNSGLQGSFARGGYKEPVVGSSSKTSTKTSSNSKKSSEEWKNEFDWLYNLMEDIAESERIQEKLATQHERYLKDSSKTGKDLYNITKQQMKNLNQQYAYQTQALRGREKEMQEQINQSGYTKYVRWNNKDRTIEIDWDKIEKIQNKDTYDKVSELVSKAEDIQSKIDTAEDAIEDIKDQMKEFQERYVQEYVDFQQRVLEAVVNKYQENIDNLNELNDTINESNTNILNSIRDEIDLQRQIRDNTDTENEISDMEARLAYLRRDTTGANQNEILQLEKQLEDTRESYSDTLIDQSIDRLADANDKAAEQREHQIQILTAQLEYWQKNGDLWPEVAKLMKEGISSKGYILFGSDLMSVLKNAEGFQGMSSEQQKQWTGQLEEDISPVNAYSLSKKHPVWDNATDYMAIMQSLLQQRGSQALLEPAYQDAAAARIEKRIAQGATREQAKKEQQAVEDKYLKGSSSASKESKKVSWNKNTDYMAIMQSLLKQYGEKALSRTDYKQAAAARIEKRIAQGATREQALQEQRENENKYLKKKTRYATGGLNTSTGLAWLDGTTKEPEYVLNARQTEAFLRLSEVLPSIFSNGTNYSNTIGGNVYLELTMNVGEIGSDYDVDRLVERVKSDIYETSAYRNVNIVNRSR